MRNLKISSCRQLSIPDLNCCEFVESGKSLVNTDTKSVQRFLFVFQGDNLYLLTLNDGIVSKCSVNHLFPDTVPQVKGILFIDIFDVLYTFHKTGEVLRYLCNSNKLETEFFLHVNDEIEALDFSPDKEIVAYITSEYKLKLITITPNSFENICEYDMGDMSQGEQILVNVGWGKKETQFHGSEGKNAALAKIESNAQESFDNKSVYISWRGDSAMFAVGYWCYLSRKRRIKIFSRDGTFMCINEDVIGLDGPMSWKPQGNLIACSQQLSNKYVISFFEKNGLKHLDFEIPPAFKIKQIIWNAGSTILCLLVQCSKSSENYLMLWTSGNYHWYLKQMLPLHFEVCGVFWDEDRENNLYIVSKSGLFYEIEFIWAVDHSASADSSKYFVSVIDNDKILLTPFHAAIIPPPMCKWTLKCPSSVNRILYPPTYKSDETKYFMCAILSDGRICLLKEGQSGEPLISVVNESLSNKISFEISMSNWAWVNDTNLICISPFANNQSTLLNLEIDEQDNLNITDEKIIIDVVMCTVAMNGKLILYMRSGKSIEYDAVEKSLSDVKDGFPELCYDLVPFSSDVYGLSEWNRLYRNGEILSYNVTSYLLHYPFLIATTSNHTLIIMKCDGSQVEQISVRKLERGSKLIAVTGNTVIMQMPRGNLETIQPRALTVLSAGKLIDKKLYKEAIHSLRKQRISFDLCVDHNPEQFFANIQHFVDTVDPQWITLLITELSDSDVTKHIYSPFYNQEERKHIISLEQKVIKVCSALLEVLRNSNEQDKYMLSILSCLVKMKKISEAIEMANNEQALQHLLFLVDVEVLYYEALGAYNLQAALKFAGKSQMDPKEYIAYLNSLQAMEENYMKYEIDRMLKRYCSALEHLSRCGDDKLDLMYSLMEEFHLYGLALKLCEDKPERYKRVAFMYAQYLYKKSLFEESGIMFVRCDNLPKAIESFTKAGNWKQCLLLAKRCSYSEEELEALGDAVCNVLISSQKHYEAAVMYKDCFSNVNKAIDMYLSGHFWNEAIYLASTVADNLNDTERKIREKVLEAATNLMDEINVTKNNVCRYASRLKQVRIDKTKKPNFREFDEMSESSSVSSRSDQLTSNSSKASRMTRKMNRKLWSLKEGNPREEEALLAVLSQTITSVEKIISEVRSISIILLHLKLDGKAEILQNIMRELVKVIKDEKYNIWPKGANDDELVALDAKYRHPPEVRLDSNWQLELFTP